MSVAAAPLALPGYLSGAAFFGLTTGAVLVAAALILRKRLSQLSGAHAVVAFALLAVAANFAAYLVPGVLGVLNRESALAAALVLVAAAWGLPPRTATERSTGFPDAPRSDRLSWWLAGAAGGAVVVYVLAFLIDRGGDTARHIDMTTFHLPTVAGWIQQRDFWTVDSYTAHWAFSYYPDTSSVMLLSTVLPWKSDFLVRFVNVPFVGLAWLGVYCAARELRARAATAVIVGALFVALPVVLQPALEGLADPLMLGSFASGIVFLLRYRRTAATADLLLAGLGLGLSLGTKWYAVPAVGLTLVVWLAGSLVERGSFTKLRGSLRKLVPEVALLGGATLVAGGFWMLRNLVASGNPVFPQKVAPLGVTIFNAPPNPIYDVFGATLAHYLDRPSVWTDVLWPTFLPVMALGSLLLWAALAGSGAFAAWRLRSSIRETPVVLALVVLAALIAVAYLVTPYSGIKAAGRHDAPTYAYVNARYVVPALMLGAITAAWLAGQAGSKLRHGLEALAVLGVLEALGRETLDPATRPLLLAVLAVAGVAAAIAVAHRRGVAVGRSTQGGLAAAVVAVLGGALLAGYAQERRYNKTRYEGINAVVNYISQRAPTGRRVGLLGDGTEIYPVWGPRLGNKVHSIGPVVDGMLVSYPTRAALARAIERGRYDLILVSERSETEPGVPRRQGRWLGSLGYRVVARGLEFGVYPSLLYERRVSS